MRRRTTMVVALAGLGPFLWTSSPGAEPAVQPSAAGGGRSAREAERLDWLARGEEALARRELDAAESALERAARIAHAADSELGLARVQMQRGRYGLALGAASHVVGAHPESAEGRVFHAWLLRIGGQQARAERVLADAPAGLASDRAIVATLAALRRDDPLPPSVLSFSGSLLPGSPARPFRLGPIGDEEKPSGSTRGRRIVATATLIDGGLAAIAPAAVASGRLWVRDGLGRLSRAKPGRVDADLAVLRLETPLPTPVDAAGKAPTRALADAFPGSVAHLAWHVGAADATPRWPLLASGFVGAATADVRELPFASPRSSGGPVFDARGRFIGVAMPARSVSSPNAVPHLVLASALERRLGRRTFDPDAAGAAVGAAPTASDLERIYEMALTTTLQVIAG